MNKRNKVLIFALLVFTETFTIGLFILGTYLLLLKYNNLLSIIVIPVLMLITAIYAIAGVYLIFAYFFPDFFPDQSSPTSGFVKDKYGSRHSAHMSGTGIADEIAHDHEYDRISRGQNE